MSALRAAEVLVGLAINLLYDLLKVPVAAARQRTELFGVRLSSSPIASVLNAALQRIGAADGSEWPASVMETVRSPEVQAAIRQVFDFKLGEPTKALSEIRDQFATAMTIFARDPMTDDPAVDALFQSIIVACEFALDEAGRAGNVAAHHALSGSQHRSVMSELGRIGDLVASLNRANSSDLPSRMASFLADYVPLIAGRLGSVRTAPSGGSSERALDAVYVPASLQSIETGDRIDLSVRDLSPDNPQRLIVLGDPGAGKSTLCQKLCFEIARLDRRHTQIVPFLIVAREYERFLQDAPAGASLLDHIGATIRTRFQLHLPDWLAEYLLYTGRALIAFDGLDEVLSPVARREIRDHVLSITERWPRANYLLTARIVGYEEAPLPKDTFRHARLLPFSVDQQSDYVFRWFSTDERNSPAEATTLQASFMAESIEVNDIRSNPLVLSLLCRLYTDVGSFPRNRADVYERCALLMLEEWDRHRSVKSLPGAYVKGAVGALAYQRLTEPTWAAGIPRGELRTALIHYLLDESVASDLESAQRVADSILEYCSSRAWVLAIFGESAHREPMFDFVHRTFRDFFAAWFWVRTSRDANALVEHLVARLDDAAWFEISCLGVHLFNNYHRQGGAEVLQRLFDTPGVRPSRVTRMVRRLAASFPFPVALLQRSVSVLLDDALRELPTPIEDANGRGARMDDDAVYGFYDLTAATEENASRASLDAWKILDDANSGEATRLASNWGHTYAMLCDVTSRYDARIPGRVRTNEDALVIRLAERYHPLVLEASKDDEALAVWLASMRKLSLVQLVSWHGIGGLCSRCRRGRLLEPVSAIIESLARTGCMPEDRHLREAARSASVELARLLIGCEPVSLRTGGRRRLGWKPFEVFDGLALQLSEVEREGDKAYEEFLVVCAAIAKDTMPLQASGIPTIWMARAATVRSWREAFETRDEWGQTFPALTSYARLRGVSAPVMRFLSAYAMRTRLLVAES